MKYIFHILLICLFSTQLYAQTDSTQNNSLLQELNASTADQEKLLPNKMMITQRMLWGEKGLMRKFNRFELTPVKRQNELKLRRTALAAHQVLGFATMGGMLAQGIVGSRLYNGNNNLKDTHEALGAAVNFTYFTTASLSLFAPPKLIEERKGYSSIKVHKWLALVHMSAMIATNVLAERIEDRPDLKPYHRAAAYTAFGAFAASMLIIKF